MPDVLRKEATPNPMAFKFICSEPLVLEGSMSFNNAEAAATFAPAAALFKIEGVLSVYLKENFVAVTAPDWADWEAIESTVREGVAGLEPLARGNDAERGATIEGAGPEEAALLEQVNEIMDLHVRPALAQDGGGVEILGIDGKLITMRYHGACGGCPSAAAGTLNAIENLLQSEVDEGIQLQAT